MSTYILHDGVLYADRRKIVNFPNSTMIKAVDGRKVKEYSWCYFASSGFELSEAVVRTILRFVTIYEAIDAMIKYLDEYSKEYKCKKEVGKITKEISDFRKIFDIAANNTLGSFNFIVVTKKYRYSCCGSKENKEEILYGTNEVSDIIGSCASAARVLLLNGVNVNDIYKILREGMAPTGEKCEAFKISDLSDEIPPVSDPLLFAYAMIMVKDHISKEKYAEMRDSMVNIRYLAANMFKKRYSKWVFNDDAVAGIVSTWESKEFRNTKAFAAYMGK